jgi:predicted ATP-dependent endonuclease of OLD family
MFEWGIEYIEINDGTKISIEKSSTLIIVGPNSSGKSTLVRDIHEALGGGSYLKVLKELKMHVTGNSDEFKEWFNRRYKKTNPEREDSFYIALGNVNDSYLNSFYNVKILKNENQNMLFKLYDMLTTEQRLNLANPRKSLQRWNGGDFSEYIHLAYFDKDLVSRLSKEVRQAFGFDIVINVVDSNSISFSLDSVGDQFNNQFDHSPEYLDLIERLPPLSQEGDGIRSFIGILLAASAGKHMVFMVDEPEAFLHPKQAFRLASILAQSAEELGRQVIIATHSDDIVRGALAKSNRVTICRLTRQGDLNHTSILDNKQLQSLWSKPILRSSSTVSGIFYSGVIICEADSDVRFYEFLVRRLEEMKEFQSPVDVYFVHGNGKDQIATLASAYKSLDVKVAAIVDIDILQEREKFKKLLSSLSLEFSEIKDIYNKCLGLLNSVSPIQPMHNLLETLRKTIDDMEKSSSFGKEDVTRLKNILNDTSSWKQIKKLGIKNFSGMDYDTLLRLIDWCKMRGLFIVPCGELESWIDNGRSKEKWLEAALNEISEDKTSAPEATQFMREVCTYLLLEK